MSTATIHRRKRNGRRWARAVIVSFTGVMIVLLALLALPAATAQASSKVTLDDVMGIDRNQFVSSVEANWSSVYEGTPYEGWYLSEQPYPTWNDGMFWPRGNPSPTGHVGMNCGGFVSRALTDAGADDYSSKYMSDWWNGAPNAVDGYGAAAGHYANARTFWRLAKTYGLEMYTYSNKWDLLASGNAVKGDIIVMIDDYDAGGFDDYGRYHAHENDSHIGIFWGESSDDDKFLHAARDIDATAESQISGCVLSTIQPKCWGSTFYLVKWRDYGGITLGKASSLPNVSDGNALYSLSGAEYGVFDSRSSAETHNASNALETHLTDSDGTWTTGRVLTPGTYYVSETTAPSGFALDGTVYEVVVSAGVDTSVNGGTVFDTPQHERPSCWALKRDAETSDGKAQGTARLSGAKFEVRYYDGYYDTDSIPANSTRTWVVQTDEDGVAQANDSSKVSGDEFYHDGDGKVIIPLGTIAIREIEAPSGYRLSDGETYIAIIEPNGSSPLSVSPFMATTITDYVQRGGVATGKVDRQFNYPAEQGSATLEGATFEITSENSQTVVVDGVEHRKGSTVMTIMTAREDMGFVARTAADCLPVGSYSIKETASSQGYLFDQDSRSWRAVFSIEEDGQVVDLTSPDACVHNLVVRGDFEFSKVEDGSMGRMSGIPFMLTSQTTGESHVVVTDENGMLSTAASWNPHSQNTNVNDDAVSFVTTDLEKAQIVQESAQLDGKDSTDESTIEEAADAPSPQVGEKEIEDTRAIRDEEQDSPEIVVDESKLDSSAGIWFNGRLDMTCDPDDELGALPFDTYIVTELPVSANKDHELVSFTITISRNARELDLGTIDDNVIPEEPEPTPAPEPSIGTTLVDDESKSHTIVATDTIHLVDTVSYQGLVPGMEYLVEGTLHVRNTDSSDAGVLSDVNGNPVSSHATFVPNQPDGTVDVVFEFSAADLNSKSVVAFEQLLCKSTIDEDHTVVATHEDISDEGQTVSFASPSEPIQPDNPAPVVEKTIKESKPSSGLPKLGDPVLMTVMIALALSLLAAAVCVIGYARVKQSREAVVDADANASIVTARRNPTCVPRVRARCRTQLEHDREHRR